MEQGGTIGWFVSEDAVVVIDTQFPNSAKNMMNGLQQKTSRKIDLLFNTHHHGDHTSGNIYLKDFSKRIIAHENCKALQEKSYGNDPTKPQAYATETFSTTWSEKAGKENVTARYFGPAHTGGDAVIHFEDSNIAHVGDLVFNRTFPYIDSKGGGSVKNWPVVLDKVIKYYSKDTIFIFGHGDSDDMVTGTQQDVIAMRDYFLSLIDFVSCEIKKGKTKDEIASAKEIPGFGNLKKRWQGARKMSLENTFEELVKK